MKKTNNKNPLVQAGATYFDLVKEEAKQSSRKPEAYGDGLSGPWVLEWLERVIKVENIDPGRQQPGETPAPIQPSNTSENQAPPVQQASPQDLSQNDASSESQVSIENENTRIEQEFSAAKRILTSYTEPDDRIGQWIRVS